MQNNQKLNCSNDMKGLFLQSILSQMYMNTYTAKGPVQLPNNNLWALTDKTSNLSLIQ